MNLGTIDFINVGYPLVYRRQLEDESIVVIINPSGTSKECQMIEGVGFKELL